jgi:hypothetical protein
MGTRLPSEGEVLIIPPAGKKGQPPHRSNRFSPFLSRSYLPGSRCIPKQDPNANAVQSECSLK